MCKPSVPNMLQFSERVNQIIDKEELMDIVQKVVFVS